MHRPFLWGLAALGFARRACAARMQLYLTGALNNEARHPSQLYQAALEGLLLFVILWLFSSKPRPTGAVSGLFLLGYGLFRLVVEQFREPDEHISFVAFDWLTMGQLLSLPMLIAGGILLWWSYKNRDTKKPV